MGVCVEFLSYKANTINNTHIVFAITDVEYKPVQVFAFAFLYPHTYNKKYQSVEDGGANGVYVCERRGGGGRTSGTIRCSCEHNRFTVDFSRQL